MSKRGKVTGDLFDNPMVNAARAAMSDEDKKKYEEIGEQLYNTIDFEKTDYNDPDQKMAEAVACIEAQLQSGLHPSFLEKNEKAVLDDVRGNEWYKKWGYVKEDLDKIVTLKPNLN